MKVGLTFHTLPLFTTENDRLRASLMDSETENGQGRGKNTFKV